MGIFNWLAGKAASEKSEEEKLLIDLSEAGKYLDRARKWSILDNRPTGPKRDAVSRQYGLAITEALKWLKEARKRVSLIIAKLESKKTVTGYRKMGHLSDDGVEFLKLMLEIDLQLSKQIRNISTVVSLPGWLYTKEGFHSVLTSYSKRVLKYREKIKEHLKKIDD
ncbi:MAG: hypothetical protein AABX64_02690 [Nanoarchaeota archaeon]